MCNDHFMKLWIVRLERRNCMKGFKEFLGEEDGVAIITCYFNWAYRCI